MADSPKRPLGVTIIGILYLLVGLLEFLAGLALLAASAATIVDFQGLSAGMVMALGGFVMLVGLIDLLIAAGCFKGWGWIWTLAVIFTIINIILVLINGWGMGFSSSTIMTTIIGLIIPLIILWYLTKKNVKAWFGKA